MLSETAPLKSDLAEDWRVCDDTAVVITTMLEWDVAVGFLRDKKARDALIRKIKQWAEARKTP